MSEPARTLGDKIEIADLLTHYLVHYINLKAGLSVERLHRDQSIPLELIARNDKSEEIVFLRVSKLRIASDDAFLKPLEAELTLELTVIDKKGMEVYRRTFVGRHTNDAVFMILENGASKLAEGVVKDALKQFIRDPELKKIIAKYKYGAIGSVVAIF